MRNCCFLKQSVMLEGVQREGVMPHKVSHEEICRVPSLPVAVVNQKGT